MKLLQNILTDMSRVAVVGIVLAIMVIAVSGCTSYRHERFSDSGQPIELTTLRAPFLTQTAIQNLKTQVREKRGTNTYSRSVGLDGVENKTDADGIQAIQNLIGTALIQALKTSAAAPVP